MAAILPRVRPEIAAGGILRDDGEVNFYLRVNALLRPEMTVLDYGAGRGVVFDGEFTLRESLAKVQGKVRRTVGVDIDDSILQHPYLDEKYVVKVQAPIPLATESVDIIIAHWVLEHVADPAALAREFYRVLKPGGWICARTPHRWSYIGIATCLIPDRLQTFILRRAKPKFQERDKFPTVYRLNTMRALNKYFPHIRWNNVSYGMNSTPRYYFDNSFVFQALSAGQAITWPKPDLMVLLQKKADANAQMDQG